MNRLDYLTQREQLMENLENIVDEQLSGILPQDDVDGLVTRLCDMICITMDPAGLP